MYTEFACYNKTLLSEVNESIFNALEYVDGISVPLAFLSNISLILPDKILLSCPIDYPNAIGDTELRIHYALRAIHNGANTIDIVASSFLFYHNEKEFIKDIESLVNLCKDKKVTPRVMIDNKKLIKPSAFIRLMQILNKIEFEYLFCSTGQFSEDPLDNIILSKVAEYKYGFKSIANGNFYLPEHFKYAKDSLLYGCRFNNYTALKRCISVYNKKEE